MSKFFLLMLFVSCAHKSVEIKTDNLKPFEEFSRKTLIKMPTRDFSIVALNDERKNRTVVGEALTGVKYKKTPVLLDKPLESFLLSYIKKEFTERSLSIRDDSQNKMSIYITELWVKEVIEKFMGEKARCFIKLDLELEMADGSHWKSQFWTKVTSRSDLGDGTEKIPSTLASCLNELVEKIVNSAKFIKAIR